jgi:hypothetical protein
VGYPRHANRRPRSVSLGSGVRSGRRFEVPSEGASALFLALGLGRSFHGSGRRTLARVLRTVRGVKGGVSCTDGTIERRALDPSGCSTLCWSRALPFVAPPKQEPRRRPLTMNPQVSGTTTSPAGGSDPRQLARRSECARRGRNVCPQTHRRRRAFGSHARPRPGRPKTELQYPRRRGRQRRKGRVSPRVRRRDGLAHLQDRKNGGATWELQARRTPTADQASFWDCFAFWTPTKV